ncbi:uncharacterized protein LOC103949551 isoform X2 [Pyrus x bretschneideri]|uniref:uncharacterized protein LOC103949551 isoform X2 n=1 Tax=Pyrus x bretschneideri TaxID=225117 RepID=UPI00202E121D|nr:uncharacterized protein LOC103949551 isoform X2 [Pyrus x bretschneideri]XP_048422320.1 uncharacterized protein LOC103949551 isoform X2 [Pyrus x bretschneideri]
MLEEGLEISQPALDPHNSEVRHLLTARDNRTEVHRNINKTLCGGRKCDENNTDPSCTGYRSVYPARLNYTYGRFVEMMAPVNSRASWRCIRHIIQNDSVHAWVLGFGFPAGLLCTDNFSILAIEPKILELLILSTLFIRYSFTTGLGGKQDNCRST